MQQGALQRPGVDGVSQDADDDKGAEQHDVEDIEHCALLMGEGSTGKTASAGRTLTCAYRLHVPELLGAGVHQDRENACA